MKKNIFFLKKVEIIAVTVAFIATVSPAPTSADTIADLQAQVQALLQQLAALQAQQPTPPSPTPSPTGQPDDYGLGTSPETFCPKLSITMQRGSRDVSTGGQVSELQIFLANRYDLNEEDIVTGYFGKLTHSYVVRFQEETGLPNFGIVGQLTRAKIKEACSGPTPTAGITVTAPNGGERWEIGTLNTITWSLYSYNPDVNPAKDVIATLVRSTGNGGFEGVGKIVPGGKASIHWEGDVIDSTTGVQKKAEPGTYHVHVKNIVTGANDTSDAPFTLVSRGVDLQVNGSDGPVTLSDNQPITVTLTLGGTAPTNSCILYGARSTAGGSAEGMPIQLGGGTTDSLGRYVRTYPVFAWVPPAGNASISVRCDRADGASRYDSVAVNVVTTPASLQVTSPNGGEKIDVTSNNNTIYWSESGLRSASIALYKNDQWLKWVAKDLAGAFLDCPANLSPCSIQTGWAMGAEEKAGAGLGAIYKIYVTGQKADGTGYVDDKSDAPFSFVATTTVSTATYRGYLDGALFIQTQNSTEADALANCRLNATNNPTKPIRCTWGDKEIYRVDVGPVSLITNAPNYAPGATITATWYNYNTTTYANDWVTYAPQGIGYVPENGTPGTNQVRWNGTASMLFFTGGALTGTKTLTGPTAPGWYELIYYSNNGYQEVMRSSPFTVTATVSSADIQNQNLANALSALESALRSLISKLSSP